MHQLSSAAVLATDLARHPNGARLADVVDRVLALVPRELAAMRDPGPEALRQRVRSRCPGRPVSAALEGLRAGLGPGSAADRLLVVESALLGTLDDLLDLLAREQPLVSAPPGARRVALDMVVATWSGSHATPGDVIRLTAPWHAALDPVPPPLPATPWADEVADLLEQVLRRTAAGWALTTQAHRALRRDGSWAEAMHVACAAASEHGRVHAVARAQLAAARALALADTGVSAMAAAMSLTAVVQALCTRDVLPASTTEALRKAWDAGS